MKVSMMAVKKALEAPGLSRRGAARSLGISEGSLTLWIGVLRAGGYEAPLPLPEPTLAPLPPPEPTLVPRKPRAPRAPRFHVSPTLQAIGAVTPVLPEGGADLKGTLSQIEKDLISQALLRCLGSREWASKLLGLNRTTLVEKLRTYGFKLNDAPARAPGWRASAPAAAADSRKLAKAASATSPIEA